MDLESLLDLATPWCLRVVVTLRVPELLAGGAGDAAALAFFDPLPAGADLYVLKSILNDWQDPEAAAILRRCAEAVAPAGRVAILGGVVPDGTRDGGVAEDRIVAAGLGGKPRTVERFRGLAREVGLEVAAMGQQPTGRFIVECRRRS